MVPDAHPRPRAADPAHARRVSRHAWMPAVALLVSIPAFYAELLGEPVWSRAAYAAAAALVATIMWLDRHDRRDGLGSRSLDIILVLLLLTSAAAPSSLESNAALALRLVASGLILARGVITFEPLLIRGHLTAALALASGVLALCGVGYWQLEPTIKTLPDGLWLAFVTASTIGYGDFVPTVTASRILSVFVVLLGFGVLSLVTATVAARWVEREERAIEREILRELHAEISALRREVQALRGGRDAVERPDDMSRRAD